MGPNGTPAQRPMGEVVKDLSTKSAKIRALAAEGYERAEIARYLGIRYQHVRNVLVGPSPKAESKTSASGAARPGAEAARMDALTAGLATTSDKIRALGRTGHRPAEIAAHLGISYQHAYNVLRDAGPETGASAPMSAVLGGDGRIVIPAAYRKAMGVEPGDVLILRCEDGELRIAGRDATIRRIQETVHRYVSADVSLVDELIAERRAEAARDAADD
jgi:bifunctional DNA-binding transcriptional regulator/antitoxin component of YhaV-PrlF toxin-antitoxin module/DNA-binding CsgD family transcriptional regulator